MATNHVQRGDVLDWANGTGSAVSSGELVIVGTLAAVALVDIADGESGSVAVRDVWTLPKATGVALTQGASCYVTAGGEITSVSTDNTYVGKIAKDAASAATEVEVLLNV